MSEGGGQQGPSMDEILASIRKIISEDDDGEKSNMEGVPPDTVDGDDDELVLQEEVPNEDDGKEEICIGSIKELYDAVVKSMGLTNYPDPEIRELGPDDVFSILLDPSRTFSDFGSIEFTPIDTTVAEAINYYKVHGTLGEYTHLRIAPNKDEE
mgnify:CR=1 FL=1